MWAIIGHSKHGSEEIDRAETLDEINYMLLEYRLAWADGWSFEVIRA
jgi:hypothetical protein